MLPAFYVGRQCLLCGLHGPLDDSGPLPPNQFLPLMPTQPTQTKPGDTNATIVRRCIREDGRILQPDKPATSVDSMFAQPPLPRPSAAEAGVTVRSAPTGHVWATKTRFPDDTPTSSSYNAVWHWVLSIDVASPWNLHGGDLYPMIPDAAADAAAARGTGAATDGEGWVAHSWFTGHSPTNCRHGAKAVSTGCVSAVVGSAEDIPALHNTRPIMIPNDTHVFDLLELAPVVHGWVLLGEVGRYVRVSQDRFDTVHFSKSGIHAVLSGTAGEKIEVTALQPWSNAAEATGDTKDWLIHVKSVNFSKSGKGMLNFTAVGGHAKGFPHSHPPIT